MNQITNQKGSIALMTVLVVSAIMLIAVLGASESQITTSYQHLNATSNNSAYYFAESCLEEAMGQLKADSDYIGGEIELANDNMNCGVLVTGGSQKTIDVMVNYENYTQSYQAEVSVSSNGEANNVRLLNWEKI